MSTTLHVPDGTDLLAEEIREETGRLLHHPIEEVKRLEHVAAEGESATTPLLLVLGVTVGIGLVAAVVLTATLLVYYTG